MYYIVTPYGHDYNQYQLNKHKIESDVLDMLDVGYYHVMYHGLSSSWTSNYMNGYKYY